MSQKEYFVKDIVLFNEISGIKNTFTIEFFRESRKLEDLKIYLLKNVDKIIEKNWGKFGKEFIVKNIINSNLLQLVTVQGRIVGIATASKRIVNSSYLLYLEFTVVHEKYQGFNLSLILNAEMIMNEYFRSIFRRKFKAFNVITITRNVRILASLKKFASSIYPDPQQFEELGHLLPANNETWALVKDILKTSWKPERTLIREGCVLIGSYQHTPWLILPRMPRHYNRFLSEMGEKYLGFSKREDKEFIVHVKFSLISIIKYFFWSRSHIKIT